ncbi:MAG: glutamate racemase [Lachnospiraceae bacterium]|nr:glutamate racemase [Lachnospiraceae bacterium]
MKKVGKEVSQVDCIGIFDSGVGGISVLRALVKELPNENFLYYGDSFYAPYGTKTVEEIQKRSVEITEYLLKKGAKAIVVACNSATSAAVNLLRERYPKLPIIGIEPALKPAVCRVTEKYNGEKTGKVMVMATPMTIREEKFKKLLERYKEKTDILCVSCPGLMEYVEKGVTFGDELDGFLMKLLGEYDYKNMDAVVLGCTHYPFLKDALSKFFGEGTEFFDGGEGVAKETRRRLEGIGRLNKENVFGEVVFENSGDPCMIELSQKLLALD